ncbi:hypothetical protein RISK_005138 [Rhodopirellula islandica]|uniref:Uncharacterized protein n=1 Tax=Rhodopirellula islandica TaxID=595434 RepID=A0A0J1B7Y6_RHOIS|nr:hypothetical protein RISK_005138 [Rhodopirellula islandica]
MLRAGLLLFGASEQMPSAGPGVASPAIARPESEHEIEGEQVLVPELDPLHDADF